VGAVLIADLLLFEEKEGPAPKAWEDEGACATA